MQCLKPGLDFGFGEAEIQEKGEIIAESRFKVGMLKTLLRKRDQDP